MCPEANPQFMKKKSKQKELQKTQAQAQEKLDKEIDAVLDVVDSLITESQIPNAASSKPTEKPKTQELQKEIATKQEPAKPEIPKTDVSASSPPILVERTELLSAIEGQNVDIMAIIDSISTPTRKL